MGRVLFFSSKYDMVGYSDQKEIALGAVEPIVLDFRKTINILWKRINVFIYPLGEKTIVISRRLQKSIRTVAVFEAIKGALVLTAGFGMLRLLHKDAHRIACEFISQVHLSPTQKYPKIFISLADNITDHKLWFFASLALIYSVFRFAEGYGLWKERTWAEWLAVASGTIYLPIEIYEVIVKISFIRVFALVANIVVIGVVGYILIQKRLSQGKSSVSLISRCPILCEVETFHYN